MANYAVPIKSEAFRLSLVLFKDGIAVTTPTLAAGDVKVSKDYGALASIATLPSESPPGSGLLQVDLSADEMNADAVTVIFHDAAGDEWDDCVVSLYPSATALGVTAVVVCPVAEDGVTVTTVQGDDYDVDNGRQITWTVSTPATLAGGAITVVIDGVGEFAGAVLSETQVQLELTAAESLSIPDKRNHYSVVLTDVGGKVTTLVRGTWWSLKKHDD
ncbi:MAG: hypothetical protein GXY55_13485 [Phycisphaerae bacterium]|nr:hypothetical protein [Phycisphaerae bacterium]